MSAVVGCQPPAETVVHGSHDSSGTTDPSFTETLSSHTGSDERGSDSTSSTISTTSDGSTRGVDDDTTGTLPEIEHVVYLAFDGISVTPGLSDDATENRSRLVDEPIDAPPWQGAPPFEILPILEDTWTSYGVGFTTERPIDEDYTMVIFTSGSVLGETVVAGMPIDCANSNPSNIGFITGLLADESPGIVARFVSLGLGQSYGLHLQSEDAGDLMYVPPPVPGGAFLDDCIATSETQSETQCVGFHVAECPSGAQNSHRELLSVLLGLDP